MESSELSNGTHRGRLSEPFLKQSGKKHNHKAAIRAPTAYRPGEHLSSSSSPLVGTHSIHLPLASTTSSSNGPRPDADTPGPRRSPRTRRVQTLSSDRRVPDALLGPAGSQTLSSDRGSQTLSSDPRLATSLSNSSSSYSKTSKSQHGTVDTEAVN
ncbi:hypothetical protein NHX12_006787 [Muraenolepis orangiensis]|uniref:Uncharacterized protein n=1 Tax=Muraenolepis orangiensis TaxID=630683 RepID=A0A9Q0IAZ0_9TELE|nr:hypothetical protein NHX12_006787 [Muraenolepis orangiensis]